MFIHFFNKNLNESKNLPTDSFEGTGLQPYGSDLFFSPIVFVAYLYVLFQGDSFCFTIEVFFNANLKLVFAVAWTFIYELLVREV